MTKPRILVAGIGNIFLGDDAFGVAVAQRLIRRGMPEGAQVVDFGIRGLELAYALMDPYDAVILVDAVPRGGEPGTLYIIEPTVDDEEVSEPPALEMHVMNPVSVLRMVRALGGAVNRMIVVGCEPAAEPSENDLCGELSPAVRRAVDEAIGLIDKMIGNLLAGERPGIASGTNREFHSEALSCQTGNSGQ